MKYRQEIKATGLGPFPIDMLRYDRCFPLREEDAAEISLSHQEYLLRKKEKPIYLVKFCDSKAPAFTSERWRSFGWQIEFLGVTKV